MSSRRLVILLVMALLLSPNLMIISAREVEDRDALVDKLISQAEDTKDKIDDIHDLLENLNTIIPTEATEKYRLGLFSLEAARDQKSQGNLNQAIEDAYHAIEYFGRVYQILQNLVMNDLESLDFVQDDEEYEELIIAVDRAFSFIERLNVSIRNLKIEMISVNVLTVLLEKTYEKLDGVVDALFQGEYKKAVKDYSDARSMLGDLHGLYQSKVKELKNRKTEQFLKQFENRIRIIDDTIDRIETRLDAEKTSSIKALFISSLNKIEQLRFRLRTGVADDILDELEDVIDEADENLYRINGGGYAAQIKSITLIQTRIRALNMTANRLAMKGRNIDSFLGEIDDAEDILEGIIEEMVKGNMTGANNFLSKMEDSVDRLDESLYEANFSEFMSRIQNKILENIKDKLEAYQNRRKESD